MPDHNSLQKHFDKSPENYWALVQTQVFLWLYHSAGLYDSPLELTSRPIDFSVRLTMTGYYQIAWAEHILISLHYLK